MISNNIHHEDTLGKGILRATANIPPQQHFLSSTFFNELFNCLFAHALRENDIMTKTTLY